MKVKDLAQVVLEREIVRVYHCDKKTTILSNPNEDVYVGSFEGIPDSVKELDIKMLYAYRSKLNIEV